MKTTVIGLGLIGGSFALSLKDKGLSDHIMGIERSEASARRALELGLVDEMVDLDQALEKSDLIVLATPVDTIPTLALKILNRIRHDQIVMDMGSIKQELCEMTMMHPNRGRLVATHPMWGTENSGPDAAQHGGFAGRTVVICERERSDDDAAATVEKIYRTLGMPIRYMSAEEQDMHCAYVSHISHITSFALALTVLEKEREEEKEVVIKSHVISVKDEIPQPKFLGKIDLNPKPKAQVAHTEPAQGAATAAAAANRPVQTAEPKAEAPKPAAPAQPAAPAAEPKVEKSEAAAPAPAPAAETAPKAVETPRPAVATPAAQPAETAPKAAEAAPAEAPKDNVFRPTITPLAGPQVLGTMDVSGFVPGGRHKRKRLQKEKVDVTKSAQKSGNAQGNRGGNGQGGQIRPGGQQNQQNQPKPGEGRRNKNKNNKAPKPIVRPLRRVPQTGIHCRSSKAQRYTALSSPSVLRFLILTSVTGQYSAVTSVRYGGSSRFL